MISIYSVVDLTLGCGQQYVVLVSLVLFFSTCMLHNVLLAVIDYFQLPYFFSKYGPGVNYFQMASDQALS